MNDTITIPTETYTFGRQYITPSIALYDTETRFKYDFKPFEDITTLELAYLMQLFMCAISGGGYSIAISKFIDEHKLNRHFLCTPQ
jgi:hypothetical protein